MILIGLTSFNFCTPINNFFKNVRIKLLPKDNAGIEQNKIMNRDSSLDDLPG